MNDSSTSPRPETPGDGTPREGLVVGETGAQRLLGFVVDVGGGDGRARAWLDLGPQHLNRHGVLHGGIAATLLDVASGFTASLSADSQAGALFLTVALDTQFVAPARSGRVTATARVTGGGRSLLFVAAELTGEDGTLIAASTGVFKRSPAKEAG